MTTRPSQRPSFRWRTEPSPFFRRLAIACTSFRRVSLPRFQVFPQEIFQKVTHDVAGLLLHVRRHVGIGVQGEAGVGVAQNAGQGLGVYAAGEGVGGKRVPLRYNNDKRKKP